MEELIRSQKSEERKAWLQETIRNFNAGHYRRVLFLMAANSIDQGDVRRMIRESCRIADPLENWRESVQRKRRAKE